MHNYYQRDLYKEYFREIWKELTERKIVSRSLKEIENSELFKFSPFKTLNEDQYNAVLHILETLTSPLTDRIIVKGTAGTGKTVLATYLIKLLISNIDDPNLDDYNADELREINGIKKFQEQYPKKKIGFVVAMMSLRTSLENVFEKIHGLRKSMILSPSDTIGDPTERLEQVRDCFLFSCYSGYAFSDAKALTPESISIGIDGGKWILRDRQKTDNAENVPLLPQALQIIEKYKDHHSYLA